MAPPPPADRLAAHLRRDLGAWPPAGGAVVVTSPARTEPGWDGRVRPFAALRAPDGAVFSVPPDRADLIGTTYPSYDEGARAVEAAFGGRLFDVMFRWCEQPAGLEPLGVWLPAGDDAVPEWLKPFGGEVLVDLDDDGRYVGGVGLKHHDDHAWEISVGTEEAARGKGIARRLVATAARRVLDEGRVPTYLHALDNLASGRVAEACGFPDRGWRYVVMMRPEVSAAPG